MNIIHFNIICIRPTPNLAKIIMMNDDSSYENNASDLSVNTSKKHNIRDEGYNLVTTLAYNCMDALRYINLSRTKSLKEKMLIIAEAHWTVSKHI